jgi:hypothetical protein
MGLRRAVNRLIHGVDLVGSGIYASKHPSYQWVGWATSKVDTQRMLWRHFIAQTL